MNFRDTCLIQALESRRLLSGGAIDPYFHSDQIVLDPNRTAAQFAVMHDGRFVVVDESQIQSFRDPAQLEIRRFNSDGTIDPTFDVKLLSGAADITLAHFFAFDANDRLVIAFGGRLSRFDVSGKLDPTFARRGWVRLPINQDVSSLIMQRDGKIVVAGDRRISDPVEDSTELDVVRFNVNGSIDQAFASKGTLALDSPIGAFDDENSASIEHVVEDARGRLVVVLLKSSTYQDPFDLTSVISVSDEYLLRYNADGSADDTLQKIDGATQFLGSADSDAFFVQDVAPLANGEIMVGLANSSEETDRLVRLRDDGTFDQSFGEHGRVDLTAATGSPVFSLQHVLMQFDGKAIIFGAANEKSFIVRVNADGALDPQWGSGGRMEKSIFQIALNPDGTLLELADLSNDTTTIHAIQRVFRDNAPAAVLRTRVIVAASSSSQTFDVTYRDDGAIDLTSLDNRDLRITGTNGFVRYAKFDRVLASNSNDGVITARYKLAAPGGAWESSDNGTYSIRLMNNQVRDTQANATAARTLGQFIVRIGGASPSSLRGRSSFQPFSSNESESVLEKLGEN